MKINKAKLANRAIIEIFATQDDAPLHGNASAIDEETDRAVEAEINRRLDSGDVWAWARVEVRATLGDHSASEYLECLGGCRYRGEADFRQPGGYFDDMRRDALDSLAQELERCGATLASVEA